MTLWQRFLSLFRSAPEPTVDDHFDQLIEGWSAERYDETVRQAAVHLADLRAGRRPGDPAPIPPGSFRIQIQPDHWIRATPSQVIQARDAELPMRPEADFPLEVA